jgi:exonuclease SbcD
MRLAFTGDLQCYSPNYNWDINGDPSRAVEFEQLFDALVDKCTAASVDAIVHPGDLFHVARPAPSTVLMVLRSLRLAENNGLPVYGCFGNHDIAGQDTIGGADLVSHYNDKWAVRRPRVLLLEAHKVALAFLPFSPASSLGLGTMNADEMGRLTSQHLLAVAEALRGQVPEGFHGILIPHWTLSGAVASNGTVEFGSDPILSVNALVDQGWGAVFAGHIHKPQILYTNPIVAHTGAFQRIDFSEERDERGFYLYDTDTGLAEWVDLPAWRLATLRWDTERVKEFLDWPQLEPAEAQEASGAIIRLKYRAMPEQAKAMDHALLHRLLKEAGALHIAGIFAEVMASDRARSELDETTTAVDALRSWLELKPELSELRREQVIAAWRGLTIAAVQDDNTQEVA